MAGFSRAKLMLQSSLKKRPMREKQKDNDQFWCNVGLDQDGFCKKYISPVKGCGVFTTKKFQRGSFLLEYCGELLQDPQIIMQRNKKYDKAACREAHPRHYMYYFRHGPKYICIDATATAGHLCKFVNDAVLGTSQCNTVMKKRVFGEIPRLVLYASRDIDEGEEIMYDYGDGSNLWWRKTKAAEGKHCMMYVVHKKVFCEKCRSCLEPRPHHKIPISFLFDQYKEDMSSDAESEVFEPVQSQHRTLLQHTFGTLVTEVVQRCDEIQEDTTEQEDQMEVTSAAHKSTMVTEVVHRCDEIQEDTTEQEDQMEVTSAAHKSTMVTEVVHRCDEIQEDTTEQEDQMEVTSAAHKSTMVTEVVHRCDEIQEDTTEQEDQMEVTSAAHKSTMVTEVAHRCDEIQEDTTEQEDQMEVTSAAHKTGFTGKPKRRCLFCEHPQADLRRHLLTVHRKEDRIKYLLTKEQSGELSRKDVLREIDLIRKEGIMLSNKNILLESANGAELECERRSSGKKVQCPNCKGIFKKQYFYRHPKKCPAKHKEANVVVLPSPLREQATREETNFDSILNDMQKDEYYDLIKTDECIRIVGKHIFETSKPNKAKDAKLKARSSMRRLSRLLTLCKTAERCEDLFKVTNFYFLEDAIKEMCLCHSNDTKSDHVKAGLKVALGTLLKFSAKVLATHFTIRGEKDKAEEVRSFKRIMKTNYPKIFSGAEYQLKEKRQRENRKQSALPNEADLDKLRCYLNDEIIKLKIESKKDYIHARRIVLARVTLINGRRGSEPAHLLIRDYQDRHTWIDKSKLNAKQAAVLERYSLAYVMGKGTALVSVFFPKSCERVIELLIDPENRNMAGVAEDNPYLFAYTRQSTDNIIGYNEIQIVCQSIGIGVIAPTSVRHRTSTFFWKKDGLEKDTIDSMMDHMGHSKDIDKNIYCVPPAARTLSVVAPIIEELDKNKDDGVIDSSNMSIVDMNDSQRHQIQLKPRRPYTRWTTDQTVSLKSYFRLYLIGKKGDQYPGREEIEQFMETANIHYPWTTVKAKIVNEKQKMVSNIKRMEFQ